MSETFETLLLFWEKPSDSQIKKIKRQLSDATKISFLPANTTPQELRKLLNNDWPLFYYDFQKEENLARKTYLQLMADLPNPKVDLGWEGANLYWFIGHAEKSLWRSKLPHQIYTYFKVKKLLEIFPAKKIILVSNDKEFNGLFPEIEILTDEKNTPSFLFSFIKSYFQEIYKLYYKKRILNKIRGLKIKPLTKNCEVLFGQFPDWWAHKNGRLNETFFNDVFNYTNEDLSIVLRINYWKDLKQSVPEFLNFLKQKNVFIAENFNTISDCIKVFFASKKVFNYIKNLEKTLLPQTEIFAPLILKDLRSWASSGTLSWNALTYLALKKMDINSAKKIFYRLEFHPHEAAICFAAPDALKVGLQHSAIGKNFFNYHFLKNEITANNIPHPDLFLVTGERVKSLLQSAGITEEKIKIIGVLRQNKLYGNTFREQKKKDDCPLTLCMPLSQIVNENLEMIGLLKNVASCFKDPLKILIKYNPNKANDIDYIDRITRATSNFPDHFKIELITGNITIQTCLEKSDALFVTGGTAPFEAMIMQIPSLVYVQNFMLNHNPIEEYPQGAFLLKDEATLLEALSMIRHKERRSEIKNYWSQILNEIMGDIKQSPKELFHQEVHS